MSRSLFHPENALMITMSQITDCIFLSLFWLLGCFPLVTAGASFAALYDAASRGLRKGDKHSWQRFLHSFRQNLKPGLVPSVIVLALSAVLVKTGVQVWNNAVYGNVSWAVFAAFAFVMLVIVGIGSILFPVMSRFENTTAGLFANTVRLGLARLPQTLVLGMVTLVTVWLCIRYVFPLFFLPCLSALISSVFIEPMLKPYMTTEEDAG